MRCEEQYTVSARPVMGRSADPNSGRYSGRDAEAAKAFRELQRAVAAMQTPVADLEDLAGGASLELL